MLRGFARIGVRAVEIGIPFSDPIADGPDIQRASEHALARGVGVAEVLELVRELRRASELPAVLMTYANPILRRGIETFATEAREAGVDGVLVSDLPPDESPETWQAIDEAGLDPIVLVAPTTDDARLPSLLDRARGFVYCLARTGVTGTGEGFSGSLPERVARIRALTELPVGIGFGISSPEQARALRGVADGVVVGAAFMRAVAIDPGHAAGERVLELASRLAGALQ
jgi:tryptophan synthase alpha chain